MKYSYYQNKKKPPVGEVTDEEVVNIIRHDEKLAHMTLDIRQHLTANDIATADFIKGELDRKSTRLNSSHSRKSRMPSSA